MKVKLTVEPLLSYGPPQYPVKERALAHPELLASTPSRWKGSPLLCAALALTVGMGGCAGKGGQARFFTGGAGTVIGEGDWVGMIQPPAFLSEQEAGQIIREEAEARGVCFGDHGTKVMTGEFPIPAVAFAGNYGDTLKTWQGQLQLDGYDEQKNVAFEYISKEDIDQWARQAAGGNSCVEMYRFHQTASRLTESMKDQLRGRQEHVGVFYDPGTTNVGPYGGTRDEEAYQQTQKEYKTEQLRLQVRDFLDWLAAEGII